MNLLILGGTSEARALAAQLTTTHPQITVITSLAGATKSAQSLPGQVRTGGFGGAEGLVDYLREHAIDMLIDATHPFAAQITDHAFNACRTTNVDYLRLDRPEWTVPTDTDVIFVPNAAQAARLVARSSKSAFLTIGRKDLAAFEHLGKVKLLIRAIEPPDPALHFDNATFITARPPFTLGDEIALMEAHQIDTLVTKASGGEATRAKLDASAQIGARIILIRRPPPPDGERVFSVDEAMAWLCQTVLDQQKP